MQRRTIFTIVITIVVASLSFEARAQDYPGKPIRLVTMFSESANSNRYRFVAIKLGEQLGVNILIDPKAGGGGIIALRDVYRAQPMGYSILLANTNFVGNTVAYKEPGYRIDDYTPVGVQGQTFYGLIMNKAVPAATLPEFVNWVKANPGKVNYGSLGPIAGSTINAERFKLLANINMTSVPYKGGDQMSLALLAGDIHVYWATMNSARTRMQNKQIIGLASTGDERSSLLPNLPTFRELGYPGMDTASWYALFAPSAMPVAMLAKLRDAFVKVSSTPEWKAVMEQNELDPFKGTNEQFMAMLRKEALQLAADFKRLNLPQE